MIKFKIQRGDILKKVIAIFIIVVSIIGGIFIYNKITSNTGDGYVTITFDMDGNITTHRVIRGSSMEFPIPPVKEGYSFVGWDNKAGLDIITKDLKFKALYKINQYTITFNSNSDDVFKSIECNYNEELPTLPIPTKDGYEFVGWYHEGVLFDEKTMPAYNLVLDGIWYSTITFTDVEGIKFDSIKAAPYDRIFEPKLLDEYKKDGEIIVWYTDYLYENPFAFYKMPTESITLYGRFEKVETVDLGFFPYLVDGELDNIIDDPMELERYLEYLVFYRKTGENQIVLNYDIKNTAVALSDAFDKIKIERTFTYKYQRFGNTISIILFFEEEATTKSSLTDLYQQKESVVEIVKNAKDPGFDNYPIDSVEKTIMVYDSEQLYHALERGYKPVFEQKGYEMSDVWKIYYEAKYILKDIISEDMNDFEKVHAIYDWLVINITYDARLKDYVEADVENISKYRGFYLEGAFLDKRAVCDGIAKAFVVLCRIEGIEAIRIVGSSLNDTYNHAWNKVRINNYWYVVDVTSGGVIVQNTEVLSHKYLLVNDDFYGSFYVANNYTNFVSYGEYDIYQEMYYSTNNDFNITSQKELNDIINWYVTNFNCDTTIDMRISFNYGDSFEDELLEAIKMSNIKDIKISMNNDQYLEYGILLILGYQK